MGWGSAIPLRWSMAFVGASIREFIAKRLVPHAELEQEEAKRVTEMVAKGKEMYAARGRGAGEGRGRRGRRARAASEGLGTRRAGEASTRGPARTQRRGAAPHATHTWCDDNAAGNHRGLTPNPRPYTDAAT